jgi:hypothetical protein
MYNKHLTLNRKKKIEFLSPKFVPLLYPTPLKETLQLSAVSKLVQVKTSSLEDFLRAQGVALESLKAHSNKK